MHGVQRTGQVAQTHLVGAGSGVEVEVLDAGGGLALAVDDGREVRAGLGDRDVVVAGTEREVELVSRAGAAGDAERGGLLSVDGDVERVVVATAVVRQRAALEDVAPGLAVELVGVAQPTRRSLPAPP